MIMKSVLALAALNIMTLISLVTAEADCRVTNLNRNDRPYREDAGFCLAAMMREGYLCGYDNETEVTTCRTASSAPDFKLDWYGDKAFILDAEGNRSGVLFNFSGGEFGIRWNDGDVDTCTARGYVVTWCE
jgi:hypothetical protein